MPISRMPCLQGVGYKQGSIRGGKNIGDRVVNMSAHVADRVTSIDSVRDAMTLLLYIIYLLSRDQVQLRAFDLTSPVCEHHNELEWIFYAR
jgi:hypothetical protein